MMKTQKQYLLACAAGLTGLFALPSCETMDAFNGMSHAASAYANYKMGRRQLEALRDLSDQLEQRPPSIPTQPATPPSLLLKAPWKKAQISPKAIYVKPLGPVFMAPKPHQSMHLGGITSP